MAEAALNLYPIYASIKYQGVCCLFAFRMEGLGLLHLLVVVVMFGFSLLDSLKFGLFRTFGKLWGT